MRGRSITWIACVLMVALFAGNAASARAKLTVMHYMDDAKAKFYQGVIDDFMKRNPDIDVEVLVTPSGSEYSNKLPVMIASGTAPDLFFLGVDDTTKYYADGLLYPLDQFIAADGFDFRDFYPPSIEQYRISGKLYALPYDFGFRFMVYNKDMFSSVGLPFLPSSWESPQWTFEDAYQVGRKLTAVDGSGDIAVWGLTFPSSLNHAYRQFLYGSGARLITRKDGQLVTGITSPEAKEALEVMYKLVVEAQVAQLTGTKRFHEGRAGLAHHIPAHLGQTGKTVGDSFTWDLAPWPAGKAGHKTSGGGTGWFMAKTTKHPEAAWRLLKEMVSREVQVAFTAQTGMMATPRRSVIASRAYTEQARFQSFEVLLGAYNHMIYETRTDVGADYWSMVEKSITALLKGQANLTDTVFNIQRLSEPLLAGAVEY